MSSVVTGGAGFIGSHLVDRLLDDGEQVTVVDDLSTGRRENLAGALERGAALKEIDITDPAQTAQAVAGAERIYHLAAQPSVTRSVREPLFDARVNVLGTISVLDAARARGAAVVNVSTGGAIYGEPGERSLPFDEASAPRVEAPYAASKLAAEHYVELYRRLHRLAAVTLRLGNVYGPRQDPNGEAGVVAIFCGRILAGEPVTIFGDGEQTRDYTYVSDVVDALLAAGARIGKGAMTGPYNVATGNGTSVNSLYAVLREQAGDAAEAHYAEPRAGEISACALDCSAAERDLDWQTQTSLPDGLRLTLESFRPASR